MLGNAVDIAPAVNDFKRRYADYTEVETMPKNSLKYSIYKDLPRKTSA